MGEKIYRLHYRGQLKEDVSSGSLDLVIQRCMENVRQAQAEGRVLTAALYRFGRMLFFYYEAMGEPLAVAEPAVLAESAAMTGCAPGDQAAMTGCAPGDPAAMTGCAPGDPAAMTGCAPGDPVAMTGCAPGDQAAMTGCTPDDSAAMMGCVAAEEQAAMTECAVVAENEPLTEPDAAVPGSRALLPESGEDVQTTCLRPEELLLPLKPFLQSWPGQKGDRLWVHMYHIYYHCVPESVEQWKRAAVPEKRRGRIAFLRDDKLFSYTYFHKAIVDEGLLEGDKYQSIALHENILFSYFEEPKTFVNVQGDASGESQVIRDWLAVDPESHFIHMPQGKGENFMFLPALFAAGQEDMRGN